MHGADPVSRRRAPGSTASSIAPRVLPQPTTRRSPSGSPTTSGGARVFWSAASFRLRVADPLLVDLGVVGDPARASWARPVDACACRSACPGSKRRREAGHRVPVVGLRPSARSASAARAAPARRRRGPDGARAAAPVARLASVSTMTTMPNASAMRRAVMIE